jgi:hypothetical protein
MKKFLPIIFLFIAGLCVFVAIMININQVKKNTKTNQEIAEHVKEQALPEFESMALPSIVLQTATRGEYPFDHSYAEVCWNNCDEWNHYNYPEIHSGEVGLGDKLIIDWGMLNPLPTEINVIHVNSENGQEIEKKKMNVHSIPLDLVIDDKMIGNQYSIEFLWKDGETILGRSMLDFKLKALY